MATELPVLHRPGELSARLRRIDLAGPVIVATVVVLAAIGPFFFTYKGNVTGFIRFGRVRAAQIHPPPGALLDTPSGYDGQYFWLQATDPLLLRDSTIADIRRVGDGFRLQRMAYPLLAYMLAAGQRAAIPWSLLAINALLVVAMTAAFALYARRRGWSGWWALALVLMPGMLIASGRDLSDPLALATMVAALLAWQAGRRWWTAALLTIAMLTRETMTIAVVAVAADAGAQWWTTRQQSGALSAAVQRAWPAVLLPLAAFALWQAYVDGRYGSSISATGTPFLPPFKGLAVEVRHALNERPGNAAWDLAYLGLMVAGMVAAFMLVRRGVNAASVAALLFSLSLLVLSFGDDGSYTRLSAPLFAALLLGGLQQRSRSVLMLCAAVAASSVLLPLAFG